MSDAEISILSEAFRDSTLPLTVDITAEDFSQSIHARLWGLMSDAARRGSKLTVDALTHNAPQHIVDYCRKIFDLGGAVADVKSDIAALKEQSAKRKLLSVVEEIKAHANDPDLQAEEIVAWAVRELTTRITTANGETKRQIAERVVNDLTRPRSSSSTGLPKLDHALSGGLFAGKLYGIAARKKVGKTALLGTISQNLNDENICHLFIGLEMSALEIEQRNMARYLDINSVAFLKRNMADLAERAANYAVSVKDFTIYEHSPGASIDEIRRMVSRAILHHKISGVILDYWQLVGGKRNGETEEYHLRNVAQWFADICRRENIWGVIAAQVNQEGNTRGGEGLKLACDCYFTLHREKDQDGAWMEMEESRYTMYENVGSELSPGLIFAKNGPHFRDATELHAAVEQRRNPSGFDA